MKVYIKTPILSELLMFEFVLIHAQAVTVYYKSRHVMRATTKTSKIGHVDVIFASYHR